MTTPASLPCVTCKTGHTARGYTTKTLTRGDVTVVVRGVPADVCDNCGAPYFDPGVVAALADMLNHALLHGETTVVRDFASKVA